MGLQPLEFSDCVTDSPYFRENLHGHEKELDRTSKAIKGLIQECKDLIQATKSLSKAQRNFSQNLMDFKFECIGNEQTDDEIVIAASLQEFGRLIAGIEDERDKMLERAHDALIAPLDKFRKDQIGGAKEGKKKFDKQTRSFCQSLERYLNLKTKTPENALQEADASLGMERRHFHQASMEYVLLLQEVQERKKFEFVEILLGFMYSWLTFYHSGHEVSQDFRPYMLDLQQKLQKTRDNFDTTKGEAEQLMNKMLEVRGTKPGVADSVNKNFTRQGYLFMMEKKTIGTTWNKYYSTYQKQNKILTMIPFNQITNTKLPSNTETMMLTSCTRRATDSIEKRFCFDITAQDRQGTFTLQALSEEDRNLWLDAMDGKEPIYNAPVTQTEESSLDEIGFNFIKKCIHAIESRGVEDQGLYRVVGVNSKVSKLTQMGLDRRKADKLNLDEGSEWEVKTITSALKNYFRSLPEPLMTFKLHEQLIAAAKLDNKQHRIQEIHRLVHKLPRSNREMLVILITHLRTIASHSEKNLMTVANLGVCFGPTLLRPQEETMAAIMDIKFCNIIVEILIENNDSIFKSKPVELDNITSNNNSNVIKNQALKISPSNPVPPSPSLSSTSDVSNASRNSHAYANDVPPRASYQGMTVDQTYAVYRKGLRPVAIYNPTTPGSPRQQNACEVYSSTSSSSESISSKSSGNNQSVSSLQNLSQSSPQLDGGMRRSQPPIYTNIPPGEDPRARSPRMSRNTNHFDTAQRNGSHVSTLGLFLSQSSLLSANRTSYTPTASPGQNRAKPPPNQKPAKIKKRQSADAILKHPLEGELTKAAPTKAMSSSTGNISGNPQPVVTVPGRRMARTLYACEAENESELSFEPNQIINHVRPSKEPGWLEGTLNGKTGLIPANYVEFLN